VTGMQCKNSERLIAQTCVQWLKCKFRGWGMVQSGLDSCLWCCAFP